VARLSSGIYYFAISNACGKFIVVKNYSSIISMAGVILLLPLIKIKRPKEC
jgi:hypothetical protein